MNVSENIKCVKLKELLVKRILAGDYPFNVRFPGIHEIESEYGVSYVTASKSLKLLEKEGYLQCRRGIGYFVLYTRQPQAIPNKKLNLLLLEECWHSHAIHLEPELYRFRNAGWQIEVVPLKSMNVHEASVAINTHDAYTLIYCLTTDWSRFAATFNQVCNRVLVVGKLSGCPQITSIVCDESASVHQILEYLRHEGRTRPAIFCNAKENELEMTRLGYWRQALLQTGVDLAWIQQHIFPLEVDENNSPDWQQEMSRQMAEYLKAHAKEMDSIVVAYSSDAFRDACRAVNVRIPKDILPVHIASPQWQETGKSIYSMLDHNISAHFETAFNILEYRYAKGQKEPGSWYFCQPLGINLQSE